MIVSMNVSVGLKEMKAYSERVARRGRFLNRYSFWFRSSSQEVVSASAEQEDED